MARIWLPGLLCLGTVAGCAWPEMIDGMGWKQQIPQPFSTLNPEDDGVAQLDIATVTWRRDQPMLQDGLWAELDEQFLPLELRQQLAQHGLRIGMMRTAAGSRLQAALANPEYAKAAQNQSTDVIQTQFIMNDQYLEASRTVPVCTVEARRVINRNDQELPWPVGSRQAKANLVVPDAEKDYVAKEVSQLELQFAIQMQKLPDGQTKIRLVPVVKCALNNNAGSSNVFLDSLKLKNAVNKLDQRYEKLAVEATLSQDQYLVVTATPVERALDQHAETWGDLAFMNYPSDQQSVLVFRGGSVMTTRTPSAPKKGKAWPLAWQTSEVLTSGTVDNPCCRYQR